MIRVVLVFHGVVRDLAGAASEGLSLEDGAGLARAVAATLACHPRLSLMPFEVTVTRDERVIASAEPLCDGDRLDWMPATSPA